jgi:hypothetical protein
MRINLPQGLENELTTMIVECASQGRTYEKYYGMIGERFCKLNRKWTDLSEEGFAHYYETEDTTSSSRIFIKILFEELLASLGQKSVVERFKDPMLQESLARLPNRRRRPVQDPRLYQFLHSHQYGCPYGEHARVAQEQCAKTQAAALAGKRLGRFQKRIESLIVHVVQSLKIALTRATKAG